MTSAQGGGFSLAAVAHSTVILTGATVLVQIIGIVRELFLAAEVGISVQLDALLIGFVLPLTLANILTSGPSTALVPAYLSARSLKGPEGARRLAGTVLVWLLLFGIGLTLLLEVAADPLVTVVGPGLSQAEHASATAYLRLLAPTVLMASVAATLFAVCQAERMFSSIAAATIIGPVTTLVFMLVLWDQLGLTAFAVGSLIGPLVGLTVLLVATLRTRTVPMPRVMSRGPEMEAYGRHAVPLTISSAIGQLYVVVDRAIASLLAPGAISALRYADTLVRTPIGAISPAFSSAVYPALVAASQEGQAGSLGSATDRTLRYVLALFTPVAALSLAVTPLAVSVAYGRGAFTSADLTLTAQIAAGFAPLIVVFLVSQIITQALNARRQGRTLLTAGIMTLTLNVILDVVLALAIGVAGIAVASSLAATIVGIFKARRLARLESTFRLGPLGVHIGRVSLAAAPPAIVCGVLTWSGAVPTGFVPGLLTLALFGIAGFAAYVVLATRMGVPEPGRLVESGVTRLRRGGLAGRSGS